MNRADFGWNTDEFKRLIGHDAEVSEESESSFDPQKRYKQVVDAVKEAGNGQCEVYRVHHGSTRAEYCVVSVDSKQKRVVGLKAMAVET